MGILEQGQERPRRWLVAVVHGKQGEVEGAGYVQDGEEKAKEDLTAICSYLMSQTYGNLSHSQGQPTRSARWKDNRNRSCTKGNSNYKLRKQCHHDNSQILLSKRLSREELESSSLETFRAQLDKFLRNLLWIGMWTRNLQRFLLICTFSMNLDLNKSVEWKQAPWRCYGIFVNGDFKTKIDQYLLGILERGWCEQNHFLMSSPGLPLRSNMIHFLTCSNCEKLRRSQIQTVHTTTA